MDLAVALFETGESARAAALLSEVRAYFEDLAREGLKHPMLDFQTARIQALEGNSDQALDTLRRVIEGGWRFWYLEGDPALKNLQALPGFEAVVNDKDMLVAAERAEVGEL